MWRCRINRQIVGFRQDEAGDWVAELDCYHGRHFRHQPPFFECEWITSAAGRDGQIGETVDCTRCDQLEWPDGLVEYKRTPVFDQDRIPPGLLRAHHTKAGVWAKIRIEFGRLHYILETPDGQRMLLNNKADGVIAPQMPHRVEPQGAVKFQVVFFRRPVTDRV